MMTLTICQLAVSTCPLTQATPATMQHLQRAQRSLALMSLGLPAPQRPSRAALWLLLQRLIRPRLQAPTQARVLPAAACLAMMLLVQALSGLLEI